MRKIVPVSSIAARSIALRAGQQAFNQFKNRSRKVMQDAVIALSKKLATYNYSLGSVISSCGITAVEIALTLAGSSIGQVIAMGLDRADGSWDGYVFAK